MLLILALNSLLTHFFFANPIQAESSPTAKPAPKFPLELIIIPEKGIYAPREGIRIQFQLTAKVPVQLCLEKDPLSQFKLQISRLGKGPLPQAPIVVQDNRELFFEPLKTIPLKAGEQYSYRLNIKRIPLDLGEKWIPGDYRLSASFALCDQSTNRSLDSAGKETPIPAKNSAQFYISE